MRRAVTGTTIAVLVFLLAPTLIVVPASLSETTVLNFPPDSLSLRWYDDLVSDAVWRDSLTQTVIVGLVATVIATPIGVMAAMSLVRGRYWGKSLVRLLIMSPLLIPLIVLAAGLYPLYSDLQAIGTPSGLGLAHAALALPFVVLVMIGAVQNFDEGLEAAARSLGANRWQAFWTVTFPNLRGAIGAAALIAFITSFDEVVLAIFLSTGNETLPVTLFNYLRTEISPIIAAVSTVLVLAVLIGALLGPALGRGSGRSRESPVAESENAPQPSGGAR